MLHLVALAGLLAALTPAPADVAVSDWWWIDTVGRAPSRRSAYLDRASVQEEGGTILAWSVFVREAPTETGETQRRTLMVFSCANETTEIIAQIGLNRRNEVLEHRSSGNREQLPQPLGPDSLTEAVWNFVCDDRSGAERRVEDVTLDSEAGFRR